MPSQTTTLIQPAATPAFAPSGADATGESNPLRRLIAGPNQGVAAAAGATRHATFAQALAKASSRSDGQRATTKPELALTRRDRPAEPAAQDQPTRAQSSPAEAHEPHGGAPASERSKDGPADRVRDRPERVSVGGVDDAIGEERSVDRRADEKPGADAGRGQATGDDAAARSAATASPAAVEESSPQVEREHARPAPTASAAGGAATITGRASATVDQRDVARADDAAESGPAASPQQIATASAESSIDDPEGSPGAAAQPTSEHAKDAQVGIETTRPAKARAELVSAAHVQTSGEPTATVAATDAQVQSAGRAQSESAPFRGGDERTLDASLRALLDGTGSATRAAGGDDAGADANDGRGKSEREGASAGESRPTDRPASLESAQKQPKFAQRLSESADHAVTAAAGQPAQTGFVAASPSGAENAGHGVVAPGQMVGGGGGVSGVAGGRARGGVQQGPGGGDEATSLESLVSRGIGVAVNQRGGAVTLRLQPESLGSLRIQLDIQQGQVRASFEAATPEARDLLSKSVETLRAALESRGLGVERIQVSLAQSGDGAGRSPDQGQQQSSRQFGHDAGDGRSRGSFDQGTDARGEHRGHREPRSGWMGSGAGGDRPRIEDAASWSRLAFDMFG